MSSERKVKLEQTTRTLSISGRKQQPWMRNEFLSVEQGTCENGAWKPLRLWNGDETDRGLRFFEKPEVVRVKMGRL